MHLGYDLLFLVPGETGGRETYAHELLKAIRAAAPDLRVTTFVNRETQVAGRGFWTEHADRCVALPLVHARRRASWAIGEVALLPGAGARAGIDVLHAPANFAPLFGPFARVLTLHDLMFRRHPALLTHAMRWGTEALLPLAARQAHLVLTGSEAAREEIVNELHIPADLIAVVPHGVGGLAQPGDREAGRRLLGTPDRPIALAVGSDLPHKNLGAALAGVAALPPDARPVLAVAGAGTDGGALAEAARMLDLASEDIYLLGSVFQPQLEDLYAAASVLIVPTRHEGFGLPVLEAMTRGVPVVCSDLPILREVAGDFAVFVDQEDPRSVANGLRRVLGGDAEIERLREDARRHASQFSWRAAAEQTLAAYECAFRERLRG